MWIMNVIRKKYFFLRLLRTWRIYHKMYRISQLRYIYPIQHNFNYEHYEHLPNQYTPTILTRKLIQCSSHIPVIYYNYEHLLQCAARCFLIPMNNMSLYTYSKKALTKWQKIYYLVFIGTEIDPEKCVESWNESRHGHRKKMKKISFHLHV